MLNYYQYSAFGETIISEETTPNRLRYNAQTEDELTGLYYLRARYYSPNIGRFTQEDVIYNDGLNLYAYCDSNPVMYCDPSGFAKKVCEPKVGGEENGESVNTLKNNHHKMTGQIYRDNELLFEDEYISGGGIGGYRDGLLHHTERKFLNDAEMIVVEGDNLYMKGLLNPCKPGCQPAIRKFVQDNGVSATYYASQSQLIFNWTTFNNPKLKGTVLQTITDLKGNNIGQWRYWQNSKGNWKRAKYKGEI